MDGWQPFTVLHGGKLVDVMAQEGAVPLTAIIEVASKRTLTPRAWHSL